MNRCVEVRTHSRLHFGLTSLGHDGSRPQFGGVGVMVAAPAVELRIRPAHDFHVVGPLEKRVARYAAAIAEHWRLPALPEVLIEIVSAPREHVGLGVGTQLALAVAAGMGEALGFAWRDPLRLAQLTGRGRRSAVGTYGFLQGGLIVDGGHQASEALGQLVHQSGFPPAWRFVLFIPTMQTGCAGAAEEVAFANLPAVPPEVTAELEAICAAELVPAAASGDFPSFADALYRYGKRAGECFAAVQGGAFCSAQTAELIAWFRGQGIAGVGQSSWGPTVFALTPSQTAAEELAQYFATERGSSQYEVLIAPAANEGATVTCS